MRFRHTDAASPETSAGSPTYDATIHPAQAGEEAVQAGRLQVARDLHLFYGKSAAAEVFSHYREGVPSRATQEMMGLSRQRDLILRASERTWDLPFPGVPLGPVPSFHRAPDTTPAVGPILAKTHHAHQVESRRSSRRRFGR